MSLKIKFNIFNEAGNEILGKGTYGNVFSYTSGGKEFAVKVPKSKDKESEIKREIKRMKQIGTHRNVIHFLSDPDTTKTSAGLICYFMPRGCSLLDFAVNHHDKVKERFFPITQQVIEGLKFIHEKGFVHRDIKCGNILLINGDAVITDLSTLIKIHSPSGYRKVRTFRGTLVFMAPEAMIDHVSFKSDVYSLGITLFEFMNGHTPYRGSSRTEVLFYLQSQVSVIMNYRSTIPEVASILDECCKYNEDKRPTLREVQKKIDEVQLQLAFSEGNEKSQKFEPTLFAIPEESSQQRNEVNICRLCDSLTQLSDKGAEIQKLSIYNAPRVTPEPSICDGVDLEISSDEESIAYVCKESTKVSVKVRSADDERRSPLVENKAPPPTLKMDSTASLASLIEKKRREILVQEPYKRNCVSEFTERQDFLENNNQTLSI